MVLEWTQIITYPFIDLFALLSLILGLYLLWTIKKKNYGGEIKGTLTKFFTLLIIGGILYTIAEFVWDGMVLMGMNPMLSFPDLFWSLGGMFILIAFVYFSYSVLKKHKEVKKDMAMMLIVAAITIGLVYYLVAAFILGFQEGQNPIQNFLDYYYPIMSALIVVSTVSVYMFFKKFKNIGRPLLLLAIGYLFAFFADMLYIYYVWNEVYGIAGVLSDTFYGIEYVFTAVAFYLLIKGTKTVMKKERKYDT